MQCLFCDYNTSFYPHPSPSLYPAGVRARRALLDPRLSDQHAPPTTPATVEGETLRFPAGDTPAHIDIYTRIQNKWTDKWPVSPLEQFQKYEST